MPFNLNVNQNQTDTGSNKRKANTSVGSQSAAEAARRRAMQANANIGRANAPLIGTQIGYSSAANASSFMNNWRKYLEAQGQNAQANTNRAVAIRNQAAAMAIRNNQPANRWAHQTFQPPIDPRWNLNQPDDTQQPGVPTWSDGDMISGGLVMIPPATEELPPPEEPGGGDNPYDYPLPVYDESLWYGGTGGYSNNNINEWFSRMTQWNINRPIGG